MNNKQPTIDSNDQALIMKIGEEVYKSLAKGMTLQEATGVSDRTLEEIYALAHGFYAQGKYQESLALFQFLTGADPTSYKYLFGLASSFHQLERYSDAAMGFIFAFSIESNPVSSYFAMDALLKEQRNSDALACAELTIESCSNIPEYQELKLKCELIKKSLSV